MVPVSGKQQHLRISSATVRACTVSSVSTQQWRIKKFHSLPILSDRIPLDSVSFVFLEIMLGVSHPSGYKAVPVAASLRPCSHTQRHRKL